MVDLATGHRSPTLVLASSSPRRLDLVSRLGIEATVCPADVDEAPFDGEDPAVYVRRIAAAKACAVAADRPDAVVLAADTTVTVDGQILAKPVDGDDARRMLRLLSGREHSALTAVTVMAPQGPALHELSSTIVEMADLPGSLIDWYIGTGEPFGKAGAYAVQGRGAVLVDRIDGDPTTVIGLPLGLTARMLVAAGLHLPF